MKEQLNMFEAASCLGVLSQETTRDTIHDDSMMDLGIKKHLDFDDTPEPVKYEINIIGFFFIILISQCNLNSISLFFSMLIFFPL